VSVHKESARRGRVGTILATAAIAAGLLIGTTACGAGQIAQTPDQAPAINGNEIDAGAMALRNVHVIYPKGGSTEEFVNGGPLELAFLIANESPDTPDKLESITFPDGKGKVTIEGETEIGPLGVLRAGDPDVVHNTTLDPINPNEKWVEVTVQGEPNKLTPGLTFPLVFKFEKAGETTIDVPIDAGPILPRQDKPRGIDADHVEVGGHH
jgi:hypothetical protein